jgi:hypothetical protein
MNQPIQAYIRNLMGPEPSLIASRQTAGRTDESKECDHGRADWISRDCYRSLEGDVAKRADVKRLFAETRERLGRPSILVNNASVYSFAPLEAVTESPVQHQCSGRNPRHAGGRRRFRRFGRQRHRPQHDREHESFAEYSRLFGVQERDRHDHARARRRVGRQRNPRQCHRAGHDRDRRLCKARASAPSR